MGKLVEIKTKETRLSVKDFIAGVDNEQKKKDSQAIIKMMEKATKKKAAMWGTSIVGFGNKRFVSPNTGREVDWFVMGFSPRKANISLYLFLDAKNRAEGLAKLGKHKTGAGCIYINKLEDIDIKVLEKMVNAAAK